MNRDSRTSGFTVSAPGDKSYSARTNAEPSRVTTASEAITPHLTVRSDQRRVPMSRTVAKPQMPMVKSNRVTACKNPMTSNHHPRLFSSLRMAPQSSPLLAPPYDLDQTVSKQQKECGKRPAVDEGLPEIRDDAIPVRNDVPGWLQALMGVSRRDQQHHAAREVGSRPSAAARMGRVSHGNFSLPLC